MTALTYNINNLKLELLNSNFVKETIHQINKDLNGLCLFKNIEAKGNSELILDYLIKEMCQIIQDLSELNNLKQFLYSVDLDEGINIEYSKGNINIKELAFQLIKRESYKVFLRNYYSKKLN